VNSLFPHERQNERDDEHIHQRDLDEKVPAEPHQLIVAKSRQSPADPDEKEKEQGNFQEKGGDMKQP
jgi:hypothetical protein